MSKSEANTESGKEIPLIKAARKTVLSTLVTNPQLS